MSIKNILAPQERRESQWTKQMTNFIIACGSPETQQKLHEQVYGGKVGRPMAPKKVIRKRKTLSSRIKSEQGRKAPSLNTIEQRLMSAKRRFAFVQRGATSLLARRIFDRKLSTRKRPICERPTESPTKGIVKSPPKLNTEEETPSENDYLSIRTLGPRDSVEIRKSSIMESIIQKSLAAISDMNVRQKVDSILSQKFGYMPTIPESVEIEWPWVPELWELKA